MNHRLSQHNDYEPNDHPYLWSGSKIKRVVISVTVIFTICISGCSLSADRATMDRQAKAAWWSGSSISDEVYPSAVHKEVYSN
ncbi:hypothetical protein D3C81_1728260 [compost metagenome]